MSLANQGVEVAQLHLGCAELAGLQQALQLSHFAHAERGRALWVALGSKLGMRPQLWWPMTDWVAWKQLPEHQWEWLSSLCSACFGLHRGAVFSFGLASMGNTRFGQGQCGEWARGSGLLSQGNRWLLGTDRHLHLPTAETKQPDMQVCGRKTVGINGNQSGQSEYWEKLSLLRSVGPKAGCTGSILMCFMSQLNTALRVGKRRKIFQNLWMKLRYRLKLLVSVYQNGHKLLKFFSGMIYKNV